MEPSTLQNELHTWRQQNFPRADSAQQLLGVVEEVGELAHAVLKQQQGIRGDDETHEAEVLDAIGDIQIFLAGFCSYRGIDMYYAYEHAAKHVMTRDWITYPHNGHSS
jgi:NTP pyrophosphatase (non-canonical NTP hydrolase)